LAARAIIYEMPLIGCAHPATVSMIYRGFALLSFTAVIGFSWPHTQVSAFRRMASDSGEPFESRRQK
jgi:hypothetical protein